MRPAMVLGIVLIVLGAVGIAVRDVNYSSHETIVNVAGVKVDADVPKTAPALLIAGGVAVAAGVAVIVIASRGP
jgi:hypothetical protein